MEFFDLENNVFRRRFEISANGIRTVSFFDKRSNIEYVFKPVSEFMLAINDKLCFSYQSNSVREADGNCQTADTAVCREIQKKSDGVEFICTVGNAEVMIVYHIFDNIAGYRKHLKIRNNSHTEMQISNLIFDDTCVCPGSFADCDLYLGNDDVKQPLSFTIEGTEDIIRCHNTELDAGWIMGSNAPGILRYMLAYPVWHNMCNGFNMSSAPFVKYLTPDESFESAQSLFTLYKGKFNSPESTRDFRNIIRKNLPELTDISEIMYCTWLPFLKNINIELTLELAQKAGELGFSYFVLDDGWFDGNNHCTDKNKFPDDLTPLIEEVHRQKMKFGLWLNIGTDYGMCDVPEELYTRRADGKIKRLGFDYSNSNGVLCLGSSYRHRVLATLERLASLYHVEYFKLDFSSIASPYGIMPIGCHAKNHEYHHGFADSFSAIYEGMNFIKEEFKHKFPNVILDFSFEAFGTERPNIAALELSALHHVSNTSANEPEIQKITKVRHNFYSWLKKLPCERILNGLLSVQNQDGAEYLLTSFAGAPLVAGDLRKLTTEQNGKLKTFVSAFKEICSRYELTEFQILALSEKFDGFMRTDKYGNGFAAFFNHTDKIHNIPLPLNVTAVNVENNCASYTVAPGECAMFKLRKI